MKRKQLQPRSDLRCLREHGRNVLGTNHLDVGDLPVAQMRERLRRDFGRAGDGFLIHDTQLLDYANVVESCAVPSFMLGDCNRLNDALRLRTREVDGQQSILQVGSQYLHSVRQNEAALELTRRDAAVEILPGLLGALAA